MNIREKVSALNKEMNDSNQTHISIFKCPATGETILSCNGSIPDLGMLLYNAMEGNQTFSNIINAASSAYLKVNSIID